MKDEETKVPVPGPETPKEPEIIATKSITIKVDYFKDNKWKSSCDIKGFTPAEAVGYLEVVKEKAMRSAIDINDPKGLFYKPVTTKQEGPHNE